MTPAEEGRHETERAALRSVAGGHPTPEQVLADLADVNVAHEELRVAEEELRVQQDQITRLLEEHAAERRWRGRLSDLVPAGLCVTDGYGMIVEANPAISANLNVSLHRLCGKPLGVYIAEGDVRAFRSALRSLGSGDATEHRLTVTVHPRERAPEKAQLFGFGEVPHARASEARVQWILVPTADQEVGSARADEADAATTARSIPEDEVVGVAAALAQLSALPVGEGDRQRLLGRMATVVRGAVPGADWVSITIGSPLEPQRIGADSAAAQAIDGHQMRVGEGPCWDAYRSGGVITVDDITTDQRWPALATAACAGAVRSVAAVPVRDDGTTVGVLNVYSGRPGAFGPTGRRIAELTGAAVAGVLQNLADREALERLATNLERALTSRAVIDQAKGVIMARLGVDADDAFARMVNLSSRLNVKVRDLATLIVEGHADAVLRAAE